MSEHQGNEKKRLHDLFNTHALDQLEEANINTGLLMGQGSHIGRKDQFHFHEEKKAFDSLESQEKRKQRFTDQIFLRAYLTQIKESLDVVNEQIDALLQRIQEAQDRMADVMRQITENETIIQKVHAYMTGDIPKKRDNESLEDEVLSRHLILMGYSPNDITYTDLRLILDREAHRLTKTNEELENSIRLETERIELDTAALDACQKRKQKLLDIQNQVIEIAQNDSFEADEKESKVKALADLSDLSVDELDEIQANLYTHNSLNVLNETLNEQKHQNHKNDTDFQSNNNSLSVLMSPR